MTSAASCRRSIQPALVLSGQHDRVTPPAAGRWLAEALPAARHEHIARAGHAPLLSHADEVVAATRDFLNEFESVRGMSHGDPDTAFHLEPREVARAFGAASDAV